MCVCVGGGGSQLSQKQNKSATLKRRSSVIRPAVSQRRQEWRSCFFRCTCLPPKQEFVSQTDEPSTVHGASVRCLKLGRRRGEDVLGECVPSSVLSSPAIGWNVRFKDVLGGKGGVYFICYIFCEQEQLKRSVSDIRVDENDFF